MSSRTSGPPIPNDEGRDEHEEKWSSRPSRFDGLAVHADALEKRFGATVALDTVSVDVRHGELFGCIGPDGGGKTTLFRILVSLLLPDGGSARVLGLDPVRDYRALRKRVGYMAGRFSLYPDLSVAENLTFFASVFGTTIAREYDRIEPIYVQLEPFKDRRADALSGGMKQKLALCCALVHRPDILFLDEPTTGVDAVSRREFWDLLARLKQQGLTTIVSTPYMDEATQCDRVALMHGGRLIAVDTPADITRAFEWPLFGVRANERYKALLALRRYEHAHSVYPFGDVIHYADDRRTQGADIASDITAFLKANGFGDASAEPLAPTVEDVFIDRTSNIDPGSRIPDPGSRIPDPGSRIPTIATPMAPVIDARELTRRFGSFTAVDRISFDIAAGEVFGFLGANGAGKTTAIRMLIGLLQPSGGSARVAGFDVATQAEQVKRSIGYMSQRFSLYEDLTPRENIRLYGGIYGLTLAQIRERTDAMLQRLGASQIADEPVARLPLGWRQKLALSVALVHEPRIVFLDEPTSGVDPITRRQFWELIYEAASRGTTVLVTTHYMDEAEYCDRISIMVAGRIAAIGAPADLKRDNGVETIDELFVQLARPSTPSSPSRASSPEHQ